MKFKVFQDILPVPEQVTYFALEQRGNDVLLVAVNKKGTRVEGGFILRINSNGKLELDRAIRADIGLELDGSGRIALS